MNDIDSTAAVAEYLGMPAETLKQWRHRGTGPRYLKVGKHVRYRRTDVDAWCEAMAVTPGAA